MGGGVDCIYIAAAAHDARFTRICVASVRHAYPAARVELLAGGPLQPGLASELKRFWDVAVADIPAGDYGWGFIKLEPLFGPPGQRFLVIDSDTVFIGDVLGLRKDDELFVVDDEKQTDADTRRLYYDWTKLCAIDAQVQAPAFVFNSGQWFGTAGLLSRDDFAPWITWSMPRRLKHPDLFMPGEQGVLNYVLNRKAALQELSVTRRKIMHWPGHGMTKLRAVTFSSGTTAPVIIHWAGVKRPCLRHMAGAEILIHFERAYFRRLPFRSLRRALALARHLFGELRLRLRLRFARWRR